VNAAELKREKRRIRTSVLARRDALTDPERERAGRAIRDRVLDAPEVADATTVLAFWSFGSEVATEPLIRALVDRGVRVALPRIVDRELEARGYEPGDPVVLAPFGAAEPAEGDVIGPGELDVVLTPGVAFDREGHRVGYGGGFYDRFLPRTRGDAARIGIAFAVQVVDEPLPAGAFDLPIDALATEAELLRFPR
jgi:5-formyltetrahydrofolate cyclo-ligase